MTQEREIPSGMALVVSQLDVFLKSKALEGRLVIDVIGGLALGLIAAHRSVGMPDEALRAMISMLQHATRIVVDREAGEVPMSEGATAVMDAQLDRIFADAFGRVVDDDEPKTAVDVAMEMLRRWDARDANDGDDDED